LGRIGLIGNLLIWDLLALHLIGLWALDLGLFGHGYYWPLALFAMGLYFLEAYWL
jgi:hypothetical protein